MGTNSHQVKKASAEECINKFGFPPERIPPFGFLQATRVYIEADVLQGIPGSTYAGGDESLASAALGVKLKAADASGVKLQTADNSAAKLQTTERQDDSAVAAPIGCFKRN